MEFIFYNLVEAEEETEFVNVLKLNLKVKMLSQ